MIEIIVKKKFNRFFLNNTNSQIINDTNGIISIKLEDENKDIIFYDRHAGFSVDIDGDSFKIIKEQDVVIVL